MSHALSLRCRALRRTGPALRLAKWVARAIAGERTRVQAMYKVRYERDGGIHQVFLDHHGWYCAEHGPACSAVREVTARREGVSPS
ncbi:MAG: hypothetical protein IPF47_00965 [Gemmatimonadetes bacterium]|nr:hypothetical protein [Gemmatimonadota bacterium]